MYMKTSTLVDEADEETMEFLAPPTRKIKRKHWLGITVAVMCVMGLAGISQAMQKRATPFEQITMAQHKFMTVFSARVLKAAGQDAAKFKGSLEVLINQVDADAPNKMCMNASLAKNKAGSKKDTPLATMTFLAKSGGSKDLAKTLKKMWKVAVQMERDHGGGKDGDGGSGDEMRDAVTITPNDADDTVSFVMKMPASMNGADEDLGDAFSDMSPKLTGSLCFGRTIEDMYARKETSNVIELPQGMEVTIGAQFASMVFQAMGEFAPANSQWSFIANGMGMMKGVAKYKARQEILFQSSDELTDAFGDIPTLEHEIKDMQRMVKDGPPKLIKNLPDLADVCEGLSRVRVTGLPMKYELDVAFTGFHPSKVLASMAQEV